MECLKYPKESDLRLVVLIFNREDLLYDIGNYGYIEGSVSTDGTSDHRRHEIQDLTEEGNVDRITRVLDLAYTECVEMLYPFSRKGIHRRKLEDELKERKAYMIVLKVPKKFSQTTLDALEVLIHEYMVSRAVEDWLTITQPEKAPVWKAKLEKLQQAIKSKPRLSRGRYRIKQHPF